MEHDVSSATIQTAIRDLGLSASPLCVHSSLRSFGHVEGGAAAIVEGLLEEQCTVMTPTFSYDFGIMPPLNMRPARNGCQYQSEAIGDAEANIRIYSPNSTEVHFSMGAIPRAILDRPERLRGEHPLCSFAAVGPLAHALIAAQEPLQVYAPFDALIRHHGFIILMGVGLDRLTLLHYAEQLAGRTLFRRWANGADGRPVMLEVGGCSDGFGKLKSALSPIIQHVRVGKSEWLVLPANEATELAVAAITADPEITHCANAECERCRDAILGGPIL